MGNFGLSSDQLHQVRYILRSFPEIKDVMVFGSRAMGNYKPGSDVDLSLMSTKPVGLNVIVAINRKLSDTSLPFRFDLVDHASITNPELMEHIQKFGVSLFKV